MIIMADIPLSLSIGSRKGSNNKNEKFHEYAMWPKLVSWREFEREIIS